MLILTRRVGETLMIGDEVSVTKHDAFGVARCTGCIGDNSRIVRLTLVNLFHEIIRMFFTEFPAHFLDIGKC